MEISSTGSQKMRDKLTPVLANCAVLLAVIGLSTAVGRGADLSGSVIIIGAETSAQTVDRQIVEPSPVPAIGASISQSGIVDGAPIDNITVSDAIVVETIVGRGLESIEIQPVDIKDAGIYDTEKNSIDYLDIRALAHVPQALRTTVGPADILAAVKVNADLIR